MDTVVGQDRTDELCLSIPAAHHKCESVNRFTSTGHGDALETLLEVLEQEAGDRKAPADYQTPQGVQAALGQGLGDLRA